MLLYIHFQNLFLTDVTFPSACMQFRAMKTSDVCVHCFFGAGPLAANIALMICPLESFYWHSAKSPFYITVLMAVQQFDSQWILLQAIAEKRPEWATRHAPSDYLLFRSMQNFLSGIRFINIKYEIKYLLSTARAQMHFFLYMYV